MTTTDTSDTEPQRPAYFDTPPPWPDYYDTDPRMSWVADLDPLFLAALTVPNGPIPPPTATLGPQWCRWIEANCRMGEGDLYGQAARVAPFQRAIIWKLAELERDLSRRFALAVISLGKGSGKSPLGAWLGDIDLAGPSVACRGNGCPKCRRGRLPDGRPHAVRRVSPDVLVMASSYEQADLILDEIRASFSDSARLAGHAEAMKGVVELKGGRGVARRRPATVKQVDGSKATTLLVDEVHELTSERQEAAYDVASGGTGKRADSLVALMSTAGYDLSTMFGRTHRRGARGDFARHEFYLYMCADGALDPTDPTDVAEGIRQANPLAAEGIASVDRLVTKFADMPTWRAMRYFWNRWVPADASWLPAGAWDACMGDVELDPDLPTWVGADMALKRDSAAVVIVQRRPDGKLQASARIWFPDGGLVDQDDADDYLRAVCATHNVHWVAADEAWWPTLKTLEGEGLPIFRMPQQGRNMIVAYAETYRLITSGILVHDGDPAFSDQITSAAPHSTDRGWTLRKGKLRRRIDSAPALAGAVFATTIAPPAVEPAAPRSQIF